jgi:transketolase
MGNGNLDQKCVNVIRGLIMDTVRAANSGHPGGAMSSADFAYVLFSEFLNTDPDDARWFNRDRFVLSAGHESALLYALLQLTGRIGMDDLKAFRQLGSLTPGHPERDLTPGVEATTGPLGQGFAMSVGLAAAEAHLAATLGADVVDHFTYVLASDGDLQEPIALGAASLAGLWGLGKLVVFYDSNKIQLAGPTRRADCCDYRKAFEAFCWQVIEVDGHDREAIRTALQNARLETSRPTLIIGHTVMAKGAATREGDHGTHGEPLPPEEIAATKSKMGLPPDQFFFAPQDVVDRMRARQDGCRDNARRWRENLAARLRDAGFAKAWNMATGPRKDLVLDWPAFEAGTKPATRQAWGKCLDHIAPRLPMLVGGSADLDPSNQTAKFRDAYGVFGAGAFGNRCLAFGVREFPMAAIMNGIALHGGLIPFGATFLTFSDYCRNAIRMSALQKLGVLYVFTHDSFHLGEDGPTHQPIEHMASLRLIPGVLDFRPADAGETALCLDIALREEERPSCLFLTRQGLPVLDPARYPAVKDGARRGGYVLADCEGEPELLLLASGSEVSLALEAMALLPGKRIRLVNMVCQALFDGQPEEYKKAVLPPSVGKRASLEAGRTDCWYKYLGCDGLAMGLDHFGESAPAGQLARKYGFTAEDVARRIRERFF